MPKVYGHRACKSLVEVATEDHTHTLEELGVPEYVAGQITPIVATDTDPGEGAIVEYADGTVIHVYE